MDPRYLTRISMRNSLGDESESSFLQIEQFVSFAPGSCCCGGSSIGVRQGGERKTGQS
jgi:hypothetical protein